MTKHTINQVREAITEGRPIDQIAEVLDMTVKEVEQIVENNKLHKHINKEKLKSVYKCLEKQLEVISECQKEVGNDTSDYDQLEEVYKELQEVMNSIDYLLS